MPPAHPAESAQSKQSARYAKLRKLLVAARNDSGVTQLELAEDLGVTQSYVSKLERGALEIGIDEFLKITRALDLDPLDILGQAIGRRPPAVDG
jgi:transcriptional regulator with XRE-family HTH domain